MERYSISKPDLREIDPGKALKKATQDPNWRRLIERVSVKEYLPWEKVRFLSPPAHTTPEEFWSVVKLLRKHSVTRRTSPIATEQGDRFTWDSSPETESFHHLVDMELGGEILLRRFPDVQERQRFIARGVMEEAIASSQLEGANTTRKYAKMFLREGRKPKDRSERMILNNFETMQRIETEYKNTKLSRAFLLELHEGLVRNTIKNASEAGRFRTDDDSVLVWNQSRGVIYHIPPSEKFLTSQIDRLIDYANDCEEEPAFVHPVTKAILLHFWIGYLHPFTDGNGRLARALFYWYLLRHKYWGFAYLPLSYAIKNSAAQYRDAYLYTEQDDFDLNYFLDYNRRKIIQSLESFRTYVRRGRAEYRTLVAKLKARFNLNERQINALRLLYRDEANSVTYNGHAEFNRVSRLTAEHDLKDLKAKGLVVTSPSGKRLHFHGSDLLKKLLES